MNRNSLSAAIALTLCMAAGIGHAQDTQDAASTQAQRSSGVSTSNTTNDNATRRAVQQMSAVQVKGQSLNLGGGLMTIQDAPKAVSTISREAIVQAAPGATFVQAINSIPGAVTSTDDYTGLNDGNATVRGYPIDEIGVTVNGAPINDSGNYKIYASEYGDTENMGDITVQQGYPDNDTPIAGAAGGSIAWVTVDPSHTAGLDFSQSLGSNSYHRTFLRANTGDTGPVRSWLSYSNNETNLWRGRGKSKVTKVDGKSVWQIDDKNSITASVQYNREVKTNYESLTKAQAAQKYKQSYLGYYVPGSNSSNFYALHQNPFRNYLASLDGEFTLSDNLRLSVVPYFQYGYGGGGSGSTVTENAAATGNFYKSVPYDLNGDGKIGGAQLVNSYSYSTTYRPGVIAKLNQDLTDNNSLEYGVWAERPRQQQGQVLGAVDPATGVPTDTWAKDNLIRYPDGKVMKVYDQYTTTTNEKVFITDNWTPTDKLSLTGSLAYIWSKRDGYVYEYPNSIGSISSAGVVSANNSQYGASPSNTFHKFTPTVGAKYQLNDENQFYFGAGKTFRAPINGALLSNALYGYSATKGTPAVGLPNKPETSTTADLGWRFYGSRVSVSVDAYASNLRNKQVSGYDQNTGLTVYTQLNSVHMRGLNSEASFKLDDAWTVYANYSYTQARQQSNLNTLGDGIYYTKGKTLLNVPRNSGYVGVSYKEGPFWASLNGKYQGAIWGDWSNTEKVGGYTTFDLSAGWNFPDFSTTFRKPYIKLNVFNLADKKALTYAGNAGAFLASNPDKIKDVNGATLFASAPYYSVLQERTFMITFGASFF